MTEKQINYFENIYNNPPIELLKGFETKYNTNLYHSEVFPCFFTGNLSLKNPIVTISLNPKYDNGKEKEQGDNFKTWVQNCEKGFERYKDDKSLHSIWKNLAKVFFSKEERNAGNDAVKKLLQKNVVNLDWCYYYSQNFPSIKSNVDNELFNLFNININKLIRDLNPKFIFVHGRALEFWFYNFCDNINEELLLTHGSKYKVLSGKLKNSNTPVFFQEWFINRGNAESNLETIRALINKKFS